VGGKPLRSSRPYLVGIAGSSCSGKSFLARNLKDKFEDKGALVISCDSYYRDLSTLSPAERATRNFDDPDAIEWELLVRHLEMLSDGKEVLLPVYDFSSHTRADLEIRVSPGGLIIIEGLFVLYWMEIRRLLNVKIFVNLSESHSLSRRLERDVRDRGRTHESVITQYDRTVRPMMNKYVLPTRAFADILVNGADPVENSTAKIMEYIRFPVQEDFRQ
jgi:uridine kinase